MKVLQEFKQYPTGLTQTVPAHLVSIGTATVLCLSESFLIGRTSLGTHQVQWFRTNSGVLAQLPSTAFFCSICGEVWGRRILQPENWVVEDRFCLDHGDGSLLHHSEYFTFEGYPKDLLLYELMLATKEFV